MALRIIQTKILNDIAKAIRKRQQSEGPIAVGNMKQAILDIPTAEKLANNELNEFCSKKMTVIQQYAFSGKTQLRSVSFSKVTIIYSYAFRGAGIRVIEADDFPKVNTIQNDAFTSCTSLTSVEFTTVRTIGNGAFNGCSYLIEAKLPNAMTFGNYTFVNCTRLLTANFPAVTSVGTDNYNNCTALKTIKMLALKTVRTNMFLNTNSLELLYLPALTSMSSSFSYTTKNLVADLGFLATLNNGYAPRTIKKMILRKTDAITSLGGTTNLVNATFINYVSTSMISNYAAGTNWSVLSGMTLVSLEGSRYENVNWANNTGLSVSLDGTTIDCLQQETVGVFKHTENISHVYDNGVELADDELMSNHTVVTSSI